MKHYHQSGEATLFALCSVVVISGLLLLVSLELRREYRLLQKRTQIFLCAKAARNNLHHLLTRTGRSNWGIRNVKKAGLLLALIPGLQGAALSARRLKESLMAYQQLELASYLKKLSNLAHQGCPLDPRLAITPFELGPDGFRRKIDGTVALRRKEWTYVLRNPPYSLELITQTEDIEVLKPRFRITSRESGARLSWALP